MKVIYHENNIVCLGEDNAKDYPALTDGHEYEVVEEFTDSQGDFWYMVRDDDCDVDSANPYSSELFEIVYYACPCCGRTTLKSRYDNEVCITCNWEDEPHCNENNPDEISKLNFDISLNQYRSNWIERKKRGIYNFIAYENASSYSRFNRYELENDELCGCYHCIKIFSPSEIDEWCLESPGGAEMTALCPHCGIDSIIPEKSGYPITVELLMKMRKYAFSTSEAEMTSLLICTGVETHRIVSPDSEQIEQAIDKLIPEKGNFIIFDCEAIFENVKYVQVCMPQVEASDDDKGYQVEARYKCADSSKGFKHYQLFVNNPELTKAIFGTFALGIAPTMDLWTDISDTF